MSKSAPYSPSSFKPNVRKDHTISSSQESSDMEEGEDRDSDVLHSDYDESARKRKFIDSYKIPHKTKKARVEDTLSEKENEEAQKDECLFASQFQVKQEVLGEKVTPWIADMVNRMFQEPNLEKVESIQKEIRVPANLYLEVPKVNPEIWNKAFVPKKMQDVKVQHMLKKQGEVAVMLTQIVDELMIERAEMEQDDLGRDKCERQALKISNVLALLGAASKDANDQRKNTLKDAIVDPILRKQLMNNPTVKDGVPATYLFGDDLTDQLKTADESRRVFSKLKPAMATHSNTYQNTNMDKSKNEKPWEKYPRNQYNYKQKDNYRSQNMAQYGRGTAGFAPSRGKARQEQAYKKGDSYRGARGQFQRRY